MMRFSLGQLGYLNKFESEFAKFHKKKYLFAMLPSYKMAIYIIARDR